MKNIFDKYNTDKKTHGYIEIYADNFEKYRNSVKTFLEIGVHEGESLKAWRDYFPNAHIVGAEMHLPSIKIRNEPRITIEHGDATKNEFAQRLFKRYGNFDIVLDDGSHRSTDIRKSFQLFWSHTKLIYCIEDLGTQYPQNEFPKRNRKFGHQFVPDKLSYMNDLKKLVDDINQIPKVRDDIFKISFYKWQVYIYRRKL